MSERPSDDSAVPEPIEGIGEPLRARGRESRWETFRMPVELSGRSFLDVGCWEGVYCAEAVRREAAEVVGIDLCTDDALRANVDRYGFEFLQMDVFGEHWESLGDFDVVLCAGMLYQVESPYRLLSRLRAATRELLVLETGFTKAGADRPMMVFHGGGQDSGNPANWWTPNLLCLTQLLETAGFEGVATVWQEDRKEGYGRVCVQATPTGRTGRGHLLPRKRRQMSVRGGGRPRRPGGA